MSSAVNINGIFNRSKQDDVLLPTLFNILLNDPAEAIKGTRIGEMFAFKAKPLTSEELYCC